MKYVIVSASHSRPPLLTLPKINHFNYNQQETYAITNLAMKLDTLAYSKRLIAAGYEPRLAEAHASLQQESLVEISEDYLSQFVTTQEFNAKMDIIDHRFETL